jgi:hypothetical protein
MSVRNDSIFSGASPSDVIANVSSFFRPAGLSTTLKNCTLAFSLHARANRSLANYATPTYALARSSRRRGDGGDRETFVRVLRVGSATRWSRRMFSGVSASRPY